MQVSENLTPLSAEVKEKINQYRKQILNAEMLEPTKKEASDWHCFFYRPVTTLTAFVVNLHGHNYCIEAVYGYASTAFTQMVGDENALIEWGVDDDEITIREKVTIYDETDEKSARLQIEEMYRKYLKVEKDELLICAKAKRKEFIQKIARKLKPLGFKKKSNTWTKALESDYYVMFHVQKSDFSDAYYFNVCIGKNGTVYYGDCYYTRYAPQNMYPMDWQTFDRDKFELFLDLTIVPALQQIIQIPLHELGKLPSFWSDCDCDRQKCDKCWMEKSV